MNMNQLELTLALLAMQVTLVLVPAAFIHLVVSRRGPAAVAWMAGSSLAAIVAVSLMAMLPPPRLGNFGGAMAPARTAEAREASSASDNRGVVTIPRPSDEVGRTGRWLG